MKKIATTIGTEIIHKAKDFEQRKIRSKDVRMVGLCLAGAAGDFEEDEIYIMGKEELHFLANLKEQERAKALDAFFSRKPPLVVVADGCDDLEQICFFANKYSVTCAKTQELASAVMFRIIKFLGVELAPSTSIHGELLVVYGEGVLIIGQSRIGKSETAVELIKRGHFFVADDVVEIKRISSHKLTGSAPESIRNFIELRGVGIIDVEKTFGVSAVKRVAQIDLVIEMVDYGNRDYYEKDDDTTGSLKILDLEVPFAKIPVQSGRNMTTLVEVATLSGKQRKLGYDATDALAKRVAKYWRN